MKYFIHSLQKNTYSVVEFFDKMIEWFAKYNKTDYYWVGFTKHPAKTIDPKIHHWQDYNTVLTDIAMSRNDMTWSDYAWEGVHIARSVYKQRDTMVTDELGRVIDPRQYWNLIALCKVPQRYSSYRRSKHPYTFRVDPVPGASRRRMHRGSYYRRITTFQERKLSCDPEIKEFINPSRNIMNLPNSWDEISRKYDHCWKAKRLNKQWMKHINRKNKN